MKKKFPPWKIDEIVVDLVYFDPNPGILFSQMKRILEFGPKYTSSETTF